MLITVVEIMISFLVIIIDYGHSIPRSIALMLLHSKMSILFE